ncbi:E3 ubiquitin protein ligase RNF185-like protein [Tanacetum coccineum]
MSSNIGESTIKPPESSSSRDTGSNDAGDFECNICFELAEDPIVTLCGHLFCWPCLYKWLHIHSRSQECPVCKALIEEEKLIPLYGRGKTQTDPRSKPVPGLEIPHRPAGQRPATAPAPDNNNFPNFGFGGFMPTASARFGNFAVSAGFGGLFPSLLDMHVHGIQNPLQYGPRHAFGPRFSNGFHGGHHHVHDIFHSRRGNQEHNLLKTLLLMIGFFVVLMMIL